MEPVRLHKLLAGWGIASRRAVEAMVAAGRIRVDGEPFTDPGRKIFPASRIEIDGRPVSPPGGTGAALVVLAFHKPAGVLSSLADQFGRPTLRQFVPGPGGPEEEEPPARQGGQGRASASPAPNGPTTSTSEGPLGHHEGERGTFLARTASEPANTRKRRPVGRHGGPRDTPAFGNASGPADPTSATPLLRQDRPRETSDSPRAAEPAAPTTRLYPIGRLDADSTGLLLMTNDGELTNRLLHPRYKVEKEYRVRFDGGPLSADERDRFSRGLELDDGLTAPCRITPSGPGECLVVLREGRKRQIKRMFTALGRRVTGLHRVRFGPVRLRNLPPGEARPLAPDEIQALRSAAGLGRPAGPKG